MVTKIEKALAERALRHRLLEAEQVEECVRVQKKLAREGKVVSLLRILRKKDYLSDRQIIFLKTGDGVGLDLEKKKHREVIEGFEIEKKIGRGGTATVYLGRRKEDDLRCAIKVLFPHHHRNRKMVERFGNEGELLQRLRHENIVAGYDTGCSNQLNYVALEYVEGIPIKDIIDERGALSEELALHVVLQTARALSHLAVEGITHRDIKPGNILIRRDGSIKLCDLGFAKQAEEELEKGYTWGTANYISPEQVTGSDLDVRSDIYCLGASLYHMVIGEVPFKGKNHFDVMSKQVKHHLNARKVKSREVSRHMHYFLEKMMAKEREIRYESADELIEDIERTVSGSRELRYDPGGSHRCDPMADLGDLFEQFAPSPDDPGSRGDESSSSSRTLNDENSKEESSRRIRGSRDKEGSGDRPRTGRRRALEGRRREDRPARRGRGRRSRRSDGR